MVKDNVRGAIFAENEQLQTYLEAQLEMKVNNDDGLARSCVARMRKGPCLRPGPHLVGQRGPAFGPFILLGWGVSPQDWYCGIEVWAEDAPLRRHEYSGMIGSL